MYRRHVISAAAAVAAAVPFAGMARAQQAAMTADGILDPAKAPAILDGTFSKLSSQHAADNATDDAARRLARLEVAEQAAVAMAFGRPVDTPSAIPGDKAALYEQFQSVSGAEANRMHVEGQIAGHEELHILHVAYAANGSDPMARGASIVGVMGIGSHPGLPGSIQTSLS